jgi:hypothetical protein
MKASNCEETCGERVPADGNFFMKQLYILPHLAKNENQSERNRQYKPDLELFQLFPKRRTMSKK